VAQPIRHGTRAPAARGGPQQPRQARHAAAFGRANPFTIRSRFHKSIICAFRT
jgi:hypothetical protein